VGVTWSLQIYRKGEVGKNLFDKTETVPRPRARAGSGILLDDLMPALEAALDEVPAAIAEAMQPEPAPAPAT
jgi:hypothetical protein